MTGTQRASGRAGRGAKNDGPGAPKEAPAKTMLAEGVEKVSGGVFKSAAVAVLKQERKLMSTGDITRVALERGLIQCQGKTPEATMASALYTDVKRKHNKSVFTRPQEGLFGLREWIAEGFFPEGWAAPADSEGVAPFKRRGNSSASKGSPSSQPAGAARTQRRSGLGRASKKRAASVWRKAASSQSSSEDEQGEDQDAEGDEGDGPVEGQAGEQGGWDAPGQDAGPSSAAQGNGNAAGPSSDPMEGIEGATDTAPDSDTRDHPSTTTADDDRKPSTATPQTAANGIGRRARRAAVDLSVTLPAGAAGRRDSHDGRGSSLRAGGSGQEAGASGAMPDLGTIAPSDMDLESPLHVLGDVALLSERVEEAVRQQQEQQETLIALAANGRRNSGRRRSLNLPLQIPGQGLLPLAPDGPKSPLEDSLAALHEIATMSNGGDQGQHSKRRRMSSISGGLGGRHGREDLQGPGHFVQGDIFLNGLHLPPALISPGSRIRRNSIPQFINPLPSPPGAGPTGASLLAGLAGGLAGSPGDGSGHGLLFSPTALQHLQHATPRIGGTAGADADRDKNPFKLEANSGHGFDPHILGYMPFNPTHPHEYGGPGPNPTPEERMADAEGLHAVVLRLEARLGRTNPVTAKSWLALARVFHSLVASLGAPAAARALSALQRAAQVAEEAAAAVGTVWQGAQQAESLARTLAAVAHPNRPANDLTPLLPTTIKLPTVLPTTLTTLPAAAVLQGVNGPLAMGAVAAPAAAPVVLPAGAPAPTGATMQVVVPATAAPAPVTAPVLNLGGDVKPLDLNAASAAAAAAAGAAGVPTKIVLSPRPLVLTAGGADAVVATGAVAAGVPPPLVLGPPPAAAAAAAAPAVQPLVLGAATLPGAQQAQQEAAPSPGKDLMLPAAPVLAHA